MKKTLLTLVFCMATAGASFAQNNAEAMRFLEVTALMQYGQQLYDRGDFSEASAVFTHVLTFDGHQAQALQYLKEMGYAPQGQNTMVAEKPTAPLMDGVNISDSQSLKNAIAVEKQVIDKLRGQITWMRANIASQSSNEPSN